MIDSMILALNMQINFDEVSNAESYFICQIQELITYKQLCEMNQYLAQKKLGKILLIFCNEKETAFTVITGNLDICFSRVKSMLWENGVLLSSEIYLVNPQIKLLKAKGER